MLQLTPEWLQSIESLKNVPAPQLQWLIDHSRHFEKEAGDVLFQKGDPVTGTFFIISGRIDLFITQNKGTYELSRLFSKDITGYLPFSRGEVAIASGKVEQPSQIMLFPVERMKELINTHFELTQALVHIMTSRVRDFTTIQQQNEKMLALGKLSAGLAHELNNPASAIIRGSISLKNHLQLSPETFKKVIAIKMNADEVDAVNNKMFEVLARKEKPPLTLMQRTRLEDNIAACLDGHEVENSQELAENFIEFGFTCDDMDEFSVMIPPAHLSPVLNWINNNLVTEKMVNDIQDASQRISSLVHSVKNFTQMDRDRDKEFTDIHTGLRNTLIMLGHRLKKGNVELVENYDASIPPVKAFVGELNQVWTNLIDNALDAIEMKGKGKLEISTAHTGDTVQVFVTDDGPGIEPEIKSRIFDPFFSTKEIGKGTGLGLDVVSRIVRQHRGSIEVESGQGKTTFTVCFPING